MTEQQGGYRDSWRRVFSGKLGSCPKCMRLSLALAVASWAVVGVVASLVVSDAIVSAVVVVAIVLTAWLVAHLCAFFVKSARWWRIETPAARGRFDEREDGTRRRFLTVAMMLLGGALFAPLLRAVGSDALAKKSAADFNCLAGPPWTINLTTPLIVGCGAASPGRTPGENALRDFLNKVQAACKAAEPQQGKKGVCEQRSCPKVRDDCVVRRPAGKDFKDDDLEFRPKQAGDPCGAADTHVLFHKKKNNKDVAFKCKCDCV